MEMVAERMSRRNQLKTRQILQNDALTVRQIQDKIKKIQLGTHPDRKPLRRDETPTAKELTRWLSGQKVPRNGKVWGPME